MHIAQAATPAGGRDVDNLAALFVAVSPAVHLPDSAAGRRLWPVAGAGGDGGERDRRVDRFSTIRVR